MIPIIKFITSQISHIVSILNVKPFDDFPVSYIQLICASVVICAFIKLAFGGVKQVDSNFNMLRDGFKSKSINNSDRKNQINNYIPKHAKPSYIPKHEKSE